MGQSFPSWPFLGKIYTESGWIGAIKFDLRISRAHDQISAVHKPSVAENQCLSWWLANEENNIVGWDSAPVSCVTLDKKATKTNRKVFLLKN